MNTRGITGVLLAIIATFFLGVILLQLKVVLLPFAVALLLSIIFKPIVTGLRSRRVPTAVSLVVVFVTFVAILVLIGWTVYASTAVMLDGLPRYEMQAGRLVEEAEQRFLGLAETMGVDTRGFTWAEAVDVDALATVATSSVGSFLGFVGFVFLVVIFMLFILASSGDLERKVRRYLPVREADRMARIVSNVDRQVRKYLVTKTLVSLGTGFFSWLVLALVGVDFAAVWGLLAFVLNFIPNFGSLVAVAAPVLLAALQFESLGVALLVLGLLFVVQNVWANLIEPRLMGFQLNLSPLLIVVCLIFWGWLWGVWGMVLAVPLTATIKILFENVDDLRPLAYLMGAFVEETEERPSEAPSTGGAEGV